MNRLILLIVLAFIFSLHTYGQSTYYPHRSYLGSLNDDDVSGVHRLNDDIILCGSTFSSDSIPFPAGPSYSEDQHDSMLVTGYRDIFISRMSEDIAELHHSYFYGGSGDDQVNASHLYKDSLLYILGTTTSEDLETSLNAYQSSLAGGKDLFIMVLDVQNRHDSIVYCSYLGATEEEMGIALTTDSLGNIFGLANTQSSDILSIETQAPQDSLGGGSDAFWFAFNHNLQELTMLDVIGTASFDSGADILLSGDSLIQVLVNSNATQPFYPDTLLAPLGGMNTYLLTYELVSGELHNQFVLEGPGMIMANSMTSFDGDLLITGQTNSSDFPLSDDAQFSIMESSDPLQGFICRLTQNDSLSYSTLLGGTDIDMAIELSVQAGYPLLLGQTSSIDFPTFGDPYQVFSSEGLDLFLCRFDSSLALNGSTYIGQASLDRIKNPLNLIDLVEPEFELISEFGSSGKHLLQDTSCTHIAFHLESQDTLYAPDGLDFLPNDGQDIFLLRFDGPDGPCGEPCTDCICNGGNGNGSSDPDDNFIHLCEGQDYCLSVENTLIFPIFQWWATDGETAEQLEDNETYQGTETDTLKLLNVSLSTGDLVYKCNVSNTFKYRWYTPKRIMVHEPPSNPLADMDSIVVCLGDSLLIPSIDSLSYQWPDNSLTLDTVFFPTGLDTPWVIAWDEYCASDTAILSLDVFPPLGPLTMTAAPEEICIGENTMLSVIGGIDQSWMTGNSEPEIIVSPSASQFFHVTAYDIYGCGLADSIEVIVHTPPLITGIVSPETCEQNDDGSIDLEIISEVDYTFLWADSSTADPYVGLSEGYYTVSATDINGCLSSETFIVVNDSSDCLYDNFLPNIFSPNGDDINDVFEVQGSEIDFSMLKVFDEHGKEVFSTFTPGIGWDGSHNGKKCPTGVYYYSLVGTYTDGISFEKWSDVTLIR